MEVVVRIIGFYCYGLSKDQQPHNLAGDGDCRRLICGDCGSDVDVGAGSGEPMPELQI
jgi:hypothetical protein